MATKRFKELKNLTQDELATKIRETEAALFQIKLKHATGQLSDTASIWRTRKDITRIKFLQSGLAGKAQAVKKSAPEKKAVKR